MTPDACAEMCAFELPDCVAVAYHTNDDCVVYDNEASLDVLIPNSDSDVYEIIRCNGTNGRLAQCWSWIVNYNYNYN